MALSGLAIQKLLPQTNCKECGSNTCLAFAMKLAAKKAEISECPYASEEATNALGLANEPPVRSVPIGKGKLLTAGGETVLYRHDKTFVNPTILAVNINDTDEAASAEKTLASIKDYALERVGETLTVDMVAVTQLGSDPERFASLCEKAWKTACRPLVLRGSSAEAVMKAASLIEGSGSVLCAPHAQAADVLAPFAKEHGHALALGAKDLDTLVETASRHRENGLSSLLLQWETHSLAEHLQTNTIVRRSAIKESFKPLGFPFLHFIDTGSIMDDTASAVTDITKYGSICVLPSFNAPQLATLLTLRLNIYTDPQKPIQVEPRVYAIGEPSIESPVFVTTNFSLTYFIVTGEIENSGISAWLVVPECEGMSVLTAWAAGKFSAAVISKFIKESGLEETISTRLIVIPGYVSQISGELEDSLPGWKVMVGPEEASDLESFIKTYLTV